MYKIIYKNFSDYNYLNTIDIKNVDDLKTYNPDADFKYCTIIEFINKLDINIENLLEAGCADSLLSAYLCKLHNIKDAYLFDFDVVRNINIFERQDKLFKINNVKSNVIFKGGDFFKKIKEIQDNTVDLIIDGCSVTHFMGNSGKLCWEQASEYFFNKLKNNGYVIVSTDIKLSEDLEMENSNEEFVYMKDIINIFINKFDIVFDLILSNDQPIDGLRVLSLCLKKKLF